MYVVAVGTFDRLSLQTLQHAAVEQRLDLRSFDRTDALKRAFSADAGAPQGFFIAGTQRVAALTEWVRERPELSHVPIVALVDRPTEGQFRDAYAAGADDAVLGGDLTGLRHRMARLRLSKARPVPEADRGLALIALHDGAVRRFVGRTMRQLGLEVRFAESEAEVAIEAGAPLALLVTEKSFGAHGGNHFIARVQENAGRAVHALVLASDVESSLGDVRTQLSFLADQALGERTDQRRSRRILHATICTFRERGLQLPTYGLTHDISREGLYVRTLDPPAAGTALWLELRSPDGIPVHLRGTVMWRRDASAASAIALAGFGLQIDEASTPAQDLRHWQDAYASSSNAC